MDQQEKKQLEFASPAALAFLGDAVYEQEVRRTLLELDAVHGDVLHKKAVPYVCAAGQAKAMKALLDTLTEDEQTVVRRARNKKASSQPRHADPVDYKWATAFEALLGYWALQEEQEKIHAFSAKAMEIVRSEL